MDRPADAVEAVHPTRLDRATEDPGDDDHDDDADDRRPEEQHRGDDRGVKEERPTGQRHGLRLEQRPEPRYRGEQQGAAADTQRDVQQQQAQHLQGRVGGPAHPAAPDTFDHPVIHLGALRRGAVPVLTVGHGHAAMQRRGVAELPSVTQRGVDVEHCHLTDDRVASDRHPAGPDHPVVGLIAGEERVLADERAVTDREQVRTCRDVAGEDHGAPPDLRAQGPQVDRVEGRPREEHHRVPPDQCLHQPEAEIGQAPHPDVRDLPAAHEDPLDDDRQGAHADERRRAEDHRTQVDLCHACAGGDPLVAVDDDDAEQVRVAHEGQELQGSAQRVVRRADRLGGLPHPDGRRRRLRRGGGGRRGRRGCSGHERRHKARDRGVLVDVFHRYRRDVGPLADPRAEPRHHHRVGTEVVEEVAVGRNLFDVQDVAQHLGEQPRERVHDVHRARHRRTGIRALDAGDGTGAPPRSAVRTPSPYRSATQFVW